MAGKRTVGGRVADCHPDRRHKARGMCAPCYWRSRQKGTRSRRVADCHPERKHGAFGMCKSCYDRLRRERNRKPPDPTFVANDTHKTCMGCREVKALDAFGLHPRGVGGRRSRCRACHTEYAMLRRDKFPDIELNSHLVRRFGITLAMYNEMVESQNGVCAICGELPTVRSGTWGRRQGRAVRPRLVVDHDHETGRIRGLLCTPCNRGIGFLGDNAKRVLAAAEYLERAS